MKKYKLQDLVSNGSHSRLKVDSDLLVGNIENGYGYGDILDANATLQVVGDVKQELILLLQQHQSDPDYLNPTISTDIDADGSSDTKTASPKAVKTFVEGKGYLTQHLDISGKEDITNKVTSISAYSTDTQYPSAKCVYDRTASLQLAISDLDTIRSGAQAGATAYQKPLTGIPSTDMSQAVQVSLQKADTALPNTTKYGATIDLSLNSTTYVLTVSLKDQDGTVLNSKTADLPIESMVVNGSYDSQTKKVVLELQSGSTIDVPVGDLVAGLQSEITALNMLDADLVDDTNSTHKFVTTSEKSTWNNKEDKIVVVTQSSGTSLTAAVGNYYRFTYDVGTLDITLPTPTGSNAQSVLFFMTTGASPAVTFTSTTPSGGTAPDVYYSDSYAINAGDTYEINCLYNGSAWVINAITIVVP